MRAKLRKRPLRNRLVKNMDQDALDAVAQQVTYIGSPEHKMSPNKITGYAKPRADASICPQSLSDMPDKVNAWLKKAIKKGCVGDYWKGGFPRYVWFYDKSGKCAYMGRLVNKGLGQYKGWPIEEWEWPDGIVECYG